MSDRQDRPIADRQIDQLFRALEKLPERVEITRVADLLVDSGRANERRPAYVQLAVPDEVVKDLRGSPERGDLLFLVRVPREVVERAESRIVLPGELR
jgi:hypothetical protein